MTNFYYYLKIDQANQSVNIIPNNAPIKRSGNSVSEGLHHRNNVAMLSNLFLILSLIIGATDTPAMAQTLLRFHGSNTIGRTLLPALTKEFLQQEGYDNIHENKGANEDESIIVGKRNGQNDQIEIHAHGSNTAFIDMEKFLCDIGMSSRPIKKEEQKKLLPILGDLRSNDSEHVIALDGIAVIVHKSNPIKMLSVTQLADIFSGTTITDWSKLGSPPGTIALYARDDNSATYELFKEAVLQEHGKSLASNAQRFEDSKELSDAVRINPLGIGFIGLNYIGSNNVVELSDTGVKARAPNLQTIKTEDYILTRRLYLYTAEKPSNPFVHKFIKFALGSKAQELVTATGLVNLDVTPVPSNPNDARNQSSRWRDLTKGAVEMQTHIRFNTGSDNLDSRAYIDIGRIYEKVKETYPGKPIILIGFADAAGDHARNCRHSQDRADIVEMKLKDTAKSEINTLNFEQSVGLCEEAPVAPNDKAEHKAKNRRVEVWVRLNPMGM